ncbi:hypothetical protein DEIPH_ctg139orf0174 [Deinococcus phoenicis]|uniref:Uncharacterized protein n=1 Tax=Deinococcus phoenicis TaxID=1476583 RepID=A0A016QJU7_9DEIO|nr:hypothetical protein [Deinococcus phoenicis]EYB66440.1 hypothetical protein DEIPH_ctg139orf0174 [Deinococcus phoenicis]
MKPVWTFLGGLVAALLVFSWMWFLATWAREESRLVPLTRTTETAASRDFLRLTGTTARLSGDSVYATPTTYSQAVYAATQDEDKPGAVVLVRADDPLAAITATRLQHMPVNAPMLFVTASGLPRETRAELRRLDPQGVAMDNNMQVYLVGNIGENVARQVRGMGFETRRIFAADAVNLAEVLDEFLAVMESNHADLVLVGATQAPEFALPAANWNAHAGDGFAWVTSAGVPPATRDLLKHRAPNEPYIYVFAPPTVVGQDVMDDLSQYGHVQRIPGATPQEMSARWAGYKDSGRKLGWWFGQEPRGLGWGIAEAGHNVIVANPADWREVVTSGVLSHMGKHAPLILTNPDGTLPNSVRGYLDVIRPTRVHPSSQVYNFAWIAGRGVPVATQRAVTELLSVQDASPRTPEPISMR